YCSDDYGDNWTTVTGTPFIKEMVYFYSGTVYGIFPDFSYSSGIWSSNDHGNNWIPEIYTTNLNSIAQDCDNNIFVGWADFPIGQRDVGVAWFDRSTQQLVEMNEDLPCFAVNQLTTHPVIDCINIVACTEYGVYLLTDYQMDVDDDLPPLQIVLFNSPNPFNPETNIYLESQSGLNGNIEIYNMKGQIIRLLPVFSPCCSYSVTWDGKTDDQRRVTSGVYFYRYVSGSEATDMKKMVMIK
ncbi:MAG: T9SS type A sorting domain-containing protein, partial [Candidatus Cloacimonetes bacterium]|nr:T9SS type A sorting domain-containing protein [Candidatus Cloacimonadota bacterium]